MNIWTRIGLVCLRLVIGWHFLFEGIEKLESWFDGPHEGRPVWSAEGYLRESQGPLAPWFRSQAGDLDAEALAQLPLVPRRERSKLPDVVVEQWDKQFNDFVNHYQLSNEQIALAKEDFNAAKLRAAQWLAGGEREVPSKLPGVDAKLKERTPQRIALYRKKLDQLQEIETKGQPAFDRDVWKDNLKALKKEIATLRTELLADLNKPLKDTLNAARARLSAEQIKRDPVTAAANDGDQSFLERLWLEMKRVCSNDGTKLERINFVTRWGVTIVGACLILGLLTRLSCVAGAAFLLMFYLAMPSLEWLPVNPRAEGHYLWVNKNIIEMVALLTLATTQSGKWVGLDGLIQFLNPFRKRDVRPVRGETLPAKAA
jgi:uncharacterized membrane protein YphA (DoxX/SURF4 family)